MNIVLYYGQGYITLTVSEPVFGGTVCGKAARTGLWGSGEVTNRSTRKEESAPGINELMMLIEQQSKMIEEMRWENILLKGRLTKITQKLESAQKVFLDLKEELQIARSPKNSGNSSLPPSSDLYKPAVILPTVV